MMLLNLACIECVFEQKNNKTSDKNNSFGEPIPTPFSEVNNSGIYNVECSKGHKSKVILDHIDFEILYEYGLNALVDGYYRDAISSFTSAMERYFEFFIKVAFCNSSLDFNVIDDIWKSISNQSERQLGAYISMYAEIFGEKPLLLNTNNEIPFRNSVIHKGYIPEKEETINYGNTIMKIIENSLINLKIKLQSATDKTFEHYGYRKKGESIMNSNKKMTGVEQNYLCLNVMVTLDVKHGRELNMNDRRQGNVEDRLKDIIDFRGPRNMILFDDK